MQNIISISQFQNELNHILWGQRNGEVVIITAHRSPRAIVLTPEHYARLVQLDPERQHDFQVFSRASQRVRRLGSEEIQDLTTRSAAQVREGYLEESEEDLS